MRLAASTSTWVLAMIAAVACLLGTGCGDGVRPGRERYNEGLALFAKGDHAGAQKALLAARDQAGVDPELRFRAAFNLGLSLTAEADAAKAGAKEGDSSELSKALGLYQQAMAWFGDALRIRRDDAEATSNLGIVSARAKALEDQLAKDRNRLEAKLDAVIEAQRGVLDAARGAWQEIQRAAGGDPLAQQGGLTQTADTQRGIGTEAGVISDIAAAEIDGIGKKEEDKRSEEEKVRLVQLQNLDLYLMEARSRMAETRARLQELAAEAGVERCEAALVALKRAREQLIDPIAALRGLAQDQMELLRESGAVEQLAAAQQPVPVWLEARALADRQQPLADRLQEVEARLKAGLDAQAAPAAGSAAPSAPAPVAPVNPSAIPVVPNAQSAPLGTHPPAMAPAAPAPADPKAAEQAKMMERVGAAMPSVAEALAAMKQAVENLRGDRTPAAVLDMRRALLALAKAIELFADLKQTLDLAWQEQQQILRLLGPEAAKQMPAKERAAETRDAVTRNLDRAARLRELLEEAHTQAKTQAEQELAKLSGSGSGSGSGSEPDPSAEARQRAQQVEEQFKLATSLREQAAMALAELQRNLSGSADPMPKAQEADAKIEELRRLFFDIVEHLQELIRNQSETKDKTAAAVGKDSIQMSSLLPAVIDRQGQHRQMGQSIDSALAKQADQAGAAGEQAAEQQKKFAAAAEEMRLAGTEMDRASGTMVAVRDQTGGKSHDLKPSTVAQAKALEHLQEALKILQPPPQQQQDDKPQQQQDEQQQQQQQQGGATQSARDQDAKRQRNRDRDGAGESVDKDW
jgi:hypothetical protein